MDYINVAYAMGGAIFLILSPIIKPSRFMFWLWTFITFSNALVFLHV